MVTQAPGYALPAPTESSTPDGSNGCSTTGERHLTLGGRGSGCVNDPGGARHLVAAARTPSSPTRSGPARGAAAQGTPARRAGAADRRRTRLRARGRGHRPIGALIVAIRYARRSEPSRCSRSTVGPAGRRAAFDRDIGSTLVDEVGLDPSPALVDLERRILDHDPTLDADRDRREPLLRLSTRARIGVGPNGTMTGPGCRDSTTSSVQRAGPTNASMDPEFVQVVRGERPTIASLHHQAVVPLHDFWREPGAAYVVTRRRLAERFATGWSGGLDVAGAVANLVDESAARLVDAERRGDAITDGSRPTMSSSTTTVRRASRTSLSARRTTLHDVARSRGADRGSALTGIERARSTPPSHRELSCAGEARRPSVRRWRRSSERSSATCPLIDGAITRGWRRSAQSVQGTAGLRRVRCRPVLRSG